MKVEEKGGYLVITDTGQRTNFSQIIEGIQRIDDAIVESGIQFVLLDFRQLGYKVSLGDAFNIVRLYEKKYPHFKNVSMASVLGSEDQEIADYWEKICIKRGFNCRAFIDIDEGKSWLILQIENKKSQDNL